MEGKCFAIATCNLEPVCYVMFRPWTRNMHCKCDNFGCRWISFVFLTKKQKISKRMMWERPKEIQHQSSEPLLSVCHRGCPAINENRIKINREKVRNHSRYNTGVVNIVILVVLKRSKYSRQRRYQALSHPILMIKYFTNMKTYYYFIFTYVA